MSAIDAALELFDDLDLQTVRKKSVTLTTLFDDLINQYGLSDQLQRLSPASAEDRGSQLSYSFAYAYELCQALIDRGVIADYRAPHFIRFGFAPLYNSYKDVWSAVEQIRNVMQTDAYKESRYVERQAVT